MALRPLTEGAHRACPMRSARMGAAGREDFNGRDSRRVSQEVSHAKPKAGSGERLRVPDLVQTEVCPLSHAASEPDGASLFAGASRRWRRHRRGRFARQGSHMVDVHGAIKVSPDLLRRSGAWHSDAPWET